MGQPSPILRVATAALLLALALYVTALALALIPPNNAVPLLLSWGLCVSMLVAFRFRSGVAACIGGCLAAGVVMESGAYVLTYLLATAPEAIEVSTPEYIVDNDLLGYAPRPGSQTTVTRTIPPADIVFSEVQYRFDEQGRRTVPAPARTPSKHALFLVGSFPFGFGLDESDALPAQFQSKSGDEFRSYNLAFWGYGPGQMLLRLQQPETAESVPEKKGIAVYAFIYDHLNRSTPYTLARVRDFSARGRFFSLDDAAGLQGPLGVQEVPGLQSALDRFQFGVQVSPTYRLYARTPFPRYLSEKRAFDTAAAIILAAREAYLEHFDGEFHTLIWPREPDDSSNYQRFIATLRESGMSVIDPREMPASRGAATLHPMDTHPSAAEVEWVAEQLVATVTRAP